MSYGSFEIVIYKLCVNNTIYKIYKEGFTLNNIQWLINHKSQPNQTHLIIQTNPENYSRI